MAHELVISLDGMGGDHGPRVVVEGADVALERHPTMRFLLHGDQDVLRGVLRDSPRVAAAAEVVHAPVTVAMDDKPSTALRRGRRTSSMWSAIEAVRNGTAQGVVSAGNTGALMAMSKVMLKTMPQVERPFLAALMPTARGESVLLDVGATLKHNEYHLVQCAVIGGAYARVVLAIPRPSVALLNVGVEEVKGTEAVKEAARILKGADLPIRFVGFVEGDDIARGTTDVVVCDGFSGNIALKAAEGTAQLILGYITQAMKRSLSARLGYMLARGAFRTLQDLLDPRTLNGGVMLGLGGVVVKSHGSADAGGFAAAIDMAHDVACTDLAMRISQDMAALDRRPPP